jgi:very-short-patch-repair endonuclease/transcriptional regulator with XRE-family HTH domain
MIPIPFDTDNAIIRYNAGESADEIARQTGVSRGTVARRLAAAGFKLRTPGASRSLFLTKKFGDLTAAVTEYMAGRTMKQTCKDFGISNKRLEKAIVKAGFVARTLRQSVGLRYTRMTKFERQSLCAKANIAKRGSNANEVSLERRAKTMEATLQLASRADLILGVWLAQKGVKFTPQKAVGRYNLDISIDELLVAVEVNGDWHYFPDRIANETKRREYLLNLGWRIIDVSLTASKTRPWKYLRPACADKIISLLNIGGGNESSFGKYCVIGGDGERLA